MNKKLEGKLERYADSLNMPLARAARWMLDHPVEVLREVTGYGASIDYVVLWASRHAEPIKLPKTPPRKKAKR